VKLEARLFLAGVAFFIPIGLIYAALTHGHELVGALALPLVGGLVGMIGGYFALLARRIDERPEDDEHAEIADGAGDQGVFAPWSWWPLVLAAAAALAFAAMAVGYWLLVIALPIGVVGLVGWVFEFSRGQHAH
jgi:hypothetical protein